jgi:REP element-mobilizing transposase RayT
MTYLLTFSCYGARLHGSDQATVSRNRNVPGSLFVTPCARLAAVEQASMREPPYRLDARSRAIVLRSVVESCAHRGWAALAAHVRESHVHVVVDAKDRPEPVIAALKAYASKSLNCDGCDGARRRWARHGSTRYLWNRDQLERAIRYVAEGQGEPMEVYVRPLGG